MTDFHNPYHFVPVVLPKTDEWMTRKQFESRRFDDPEPSETAHREADQSRYLKGDEIYHGCLVCRLTTETPIFIGAKRRKEATDSAPAEVEPFELGGRPAIPATSLRGMISAIAEAASGSALRVLEDRVLSYRKEARVPLKKLGMVFWRKGHPCLLHLPDPIKVDRHLVKDQQSFRWDKKCFHYGRKGKTTFSDPGDLLTEKDFDEQAREDKTKRNDYQIGILRIMACGERTDLPNDRSHELFIPFGYRTEEDLLAVDEQRFHEIPREVMTRFELLSDERTAATEKLGELRIHPYEPKGTLRNLEKDPDNNTLRLKDGDVVYFEFNQGNQVTEIAFSAIWRAPVVNKQGDPAKVWRFFERSSKNRSNREALPFHAERNYISPAELLFGFVEERNKDKVFETAALAYASRIRFSNAFLQAGENNENPYLAEVPLKILDSPKPPSPSLYFKNKQGTGFIAKADLNPVRHEPQGRKFYLHHPDYGSEPWRTRITQGKDARWKQKVKITPLRRQLRFYFHVDFNNLSRYELGMLCYALQPGDGFQHKIGMGKPIGLGSVRIEPLVLYSIDRTARYRDADPFEAPRYRFAHCLNGVDRVKQLPKDYRFEAADETSGKGFLEGITGDFRETIEKSVARAIQLLGRPGEAAAPVHTPVRQFRQKGKGQRAGESAGSIDLQRRHLEEKTYEWFRENNRIGENKKKWPHEKKSAQSLEPLDAATSRLPTLKRN